jgi:hypothetical protein
MQLCASGCQAVKGQLRATWLTRAVITEVDQYALDEFGAWLRELRLSRALSQGGLAGRSGVPQSTISRLERGLRPRLRASAVARILIVLGVVRRRNQRAEV